MVKKFRPITPSLRQLVLPSYDELSSVKPKSRKRPKPNRGLTTGKNRGSGRNNLGRITCRHRGGGHKRRYRLIDFKRDKEGISAKVASIEYDPNRSGHIALLNYVDGEKRYITAPQGLKVGDTVCTSDQPPYKVGYCMKMKDMPLGSVIHNIEMTPGKGAKLVRSAGMSAQLMARSGGYITLKMPSGEVRLVHQDCRATFGAVSNSEHSQRVEGKAGRNRWKGIRPTVRGTAMNPCDHPHGGGEGRHNGYLPRTPWAQFTKGYRTRDKKRSTKHLVKDRRK
jgi:large subunit ribosomal protein L2